SVHHRQTVVGQALATSRRQLSHFGHLFALERLGDRPRDEDLTKADFSRSLLHVARHQGVVVYRTGVGHRHHRAETSGHRGAAAAQDRLLALIPRLAQVHVQVYQSRQTPPSAGIDDASALDGRSLLQDVRNPPVSQHQVPDGAEAVNGIDQPPSADDGRPYHAKVSKMAIRMATPLATCSRIELRTPSATSAESSTPRLTGPG